MQFWLTQLLNGLSFAALLLSDQWLRPELYEGMYRSVQPQVGSRSG
jgi:hypothetical protein